MTVMYKLRDRLSHPVAWVTLVLAILGSAMIALACPIGMPASNDADDAVAWIACSWGGVFMAQLISLGAWAALRDGRWLSRLSIPAALLVIHIVASSVGERMNSEPTNGSSAVASFAVFGTAYLLFLLLRRGGWRIGPTREGTFVFSLKQLFLAITFVAAALAIWTWSATDFRGHIVLSPRSVRLLDVAGALLVTSIVTLLFCLLAIPAIGVVMDGRTRYAIWLLSVLAISSAVLVAGSLLGPTLAQAIVPVAFVLVTMWVFHAYRMCNYHFIGVLSLQPPRRRWFFAGVGLALASIMYSAFTLRDLRVENALKQPWTPLGILPWHAEGSQLTGVIFFRSGIGITRPGVEALKHESLLREINVECAATPEQIGWLTELRTLDVLMLSGKNKRDPHLRSLYQAEHLKRVELHDTAASIAEVKKLQQFLVGCEVCMTNRGKLIVGPPTKVRKQQDVVP